MNEPLQPFPGKEHLIPVPRGRVQVIEYGNTNKPVLVALHGWADVLERSPVLIQKLAEAFHLFTIILPGYGHSTENRHARSLPFLANLIDTVTNSLQLTTFDLLGYSLGSEIVATYLAQHRQFPGKVVLLGAPLETTQKPQWFQILKIPLMVEVFRVFPLCRNMCINGALQQVRQLSHRREKPLSRLKVRDATPLGIFDTLLAGLSAFPSPTEHQQPIAFIYGENDKLLPLEIPKPHTCDLIPDTSHILHYEEPELVAEAVIKRLR